MRKVPIFILVAALSLIAGVVIAGRPRTVDRDLRAAEIPPATSTSTTTTTIALPQTASLPPTSTATSTAVETDASTEPAQEAPASLSESDAEATTEPATSTTTTTTTSTTTTSTTTTTTTTTVAPTTTIRPEARVVVVIANASNTLGLAQQSVDLIREHGYVFVLRTDGLREHGETQIYYQPGYRIEARILARYLDADLGIVGPLPEEDLVEGNPEFDVMVLLGNDWQDATNLES